MRCRNWWSRQQAKWRKAPSPDVSPKKKGLYIFTAFAGPPLTYCNKLIFWRHIKSQPIPCLEVALCAYTLLLYSFLLCSRATSTATIHQCSTYSGLLASFFEPNLLRTKSQELTSESGIFMPQYEGKPSLSRKHLVSTVSGWTLPRKTRVFCPVWQFLRARATRRAAWLLIFGNENSVKISG